MFVSLFTVQGLEVFGEGDSCAHHFPFESSEVICPTLRDVPCVRGPQEGLKDASHISLGSVLGWRYVL